MSQVEIIARSPKQALQKAATKLEAPLEELTILEEYDPDDLDLKNLTEEENANPELKIPGEPVLYLISKNMEKTLEEIQEWLTGLMTRFQKGITVEMVYEESVVTAVFHAEDPSILIGRQGQTLEALQHVVSRVLPRLIPHCPHVQLDVGDYREKRLEKLEEIADRAVEKAKRFRRNVDLLPMSSQDRKYIHNYLKDVQGIKTNSYGNDPNRHLRIEVPGGDKPARGESRRDARREGRPRDREDRQRDRENRRANRSGNVGNSAEAPKRRRDVDGNRADLPLPKEAQGRAEYFYRSEPLEQPKKLTIDEMLGRLPGDGLDEDYNDEEEFFDDEEYEDEEEYIEEEDDDAEEEPKPKPGKKSRRMIDEIE
ncbi:MAG: R3H domain-containing nucleic acid-binding protein [Candidatus Sumerlaeia bacterium]|nr:R3H domain-containing nucleic acid-binding protein [Candidatus Sumerlaeia bacterium]